MSRRPRGPFRRKQPYSHTGSGRRPHTSASTPSRSMWTPVFGCIATPQTRGRAPSLGLAPTLADASLLRATPHQTPLGFGKEARSRGFFTDSAQSRPSFASGLSTARSPTLDGEPRWWPTTLWPLPPPRTQPSTSLASQAGFPHRRVHRSGPQWGQRGRAAARRREQQAPEVSAGDKVTNCRFGLGAGC